MVRPKLVKPRGILHAKSGDPGPGYARYWPADDLAPFVEHFWRLEWDLPEPGQAEVLSHPSVHLAFERGRSGVNGVVTGRFIRRLEGMGRILGVKFRPGGFRPFLNGPVSTLTDRILPVGEVFGTAGATLEEHVVAQAEDGAAIELVQAFLRGRHPVADEAVELVGRIADRVAGDREITRVEQLVGEFGIGTRKLQRLFDDYVGVTPKWVIQRYRLHEAAERIASGTAIDFAALALDLGYADQAHFIRDFRRLVGRSPGSYARAL